MVLLLRAASASCVKSIRYSHQEVWVRVFSVQCSGNWLALLAGSAFPLTPSLSGSLELPSSQPQLSGLSGICPCDSAHVCVCLRLSTSFKYQQPSQPLATSQVPIRLRASPLSSGTYRALSSTLNALNWLHRPPASRITHRPLYLLLPSSPTLSLDARPPKALIGGFTFHRIQLFEVSPKHPSLSFRRPGALHRNPNTAVGTPDLVLTG